MSTPASNAHLVRPAARAVIIHDGKLLCIQMRDEQGVFYVFPGGGQRFGETMHMALTRECLEELGVAPLILEMLFVREYIGPNHDFPEEHAAFHALECFFRCELPPNTPLKAGADPDHGQEGLAWLPLEKLSEFRLYPKQAAALGKDLAKLKNPVYWGDVN